MAQTEQWLKSESDETHQQFVSKLIRYSVFGLIVFLCIFAFVVAHKAIKQAPPVMLQIQEKELTPLQYEKLNTVIHESQGIGSFFSFNLPVIREQILDLAWVDEVNITRNWNTGIVVEVLPKQPIARFGSEHVIDGKGQVYKPASIDTLIQSDLVMLQGSPEQAEAIMQQMQQINTWYEPLGLSVKDIILTPRMTWLIKFDSGLRLLVDGENTSQKLLTVSTALQNQLTNKLDNIQSIDLRYKNGFAIAWKPLPSKNIEEHAK